ncbi:homoserine kinase [Agilicoccus flavus]|uniref:homoserine kinase n=1 Tax=Agilicoccus flavus TaxID=2775968 RepID=UPI001CF645D1|nr:homoserine kinase [Agilicoccus flavus]
MAVLPPVAPGAAASVTVPASSANLGPGFDSVGLALGVWDTYAARALDAPGVRIEVRGDAQGVPLDERHLVNATMRRAWAEWGVTPPAGLELTCDNAIRQGRGMGSSAAAIVGGVALAMALCLAPDASEAGADRVDVPADPRGGVDGHGRAGRGEATGRIPLDLDVVNDLAGRLEGHPDNASASVYGGATLSWTDDDVAPGSVGAVRTARLMLHPDITPVVVVPEVQLPTATARAVLPGHVPHVEAALNSARAGLLVLALTSRPDLLRPAMREWLHQEQRRSSLGGAMEVVDALRAAGHAAAISGAGPSVLVLTVAGEAAGRPVEDLVPAGWRPLRPGVPPEGVRASVLH